MGQLGRGRGAGLVAATILVVALCGACGHSDAKPKIAKLPVASLPPSTTAAAGGAASGAKAGGAAAPPSSAPGPAASSPKATFLAAANAICKATNDQLDKLGDDLDDPTAAQSADLLEQGAGLVQSMLDRIHALPQPPDDPATLATFYMANSQVVGVVRQGATAVRAGDPNALSNLNTQADPLNKSAEAAADRYGLTECGAAARRRVTTGRPDWWAGVHHPS